MIVNVPDEDAQFYLDLMNWLDVEVRPTKEVVEFRIKEQEKRLIEAFRQVKLHREGKIKLRNAREVLAELDNPKFVPFIIEVDEDYLDFIEKLASKLIILKGNESQED